MRYSFHLITLLVLSSSVSVKADDKVSQYAISLNQSRLIYNEGKGVISNSVKVSNGQDVPMLVKANTWLEVGKKKSASYVVTPPIFRLNAGATNALVIVNNQVGFPADRETLDWLCVQAAPPAENDTYVAKDNNKVANKILFSVRNCIKMFYRPKSLANKDPVEQAQQITWQRKGDKLQVTNPSPFYVNLTNVMINGKVINVGYVPPFEEKSVDLPSAIKNASSIEWQVINDYGGESEVTKSNIG